MGLGRPDAERAVERERHRAARAVADLGLSQREHDQREAEAAQQGRPGPPARAPGEQQPEHGEADGHCDQQQERVREAHR